MNKINKINLIIIIALILSMIVLFPKSKNTEELLANSVANKEIQEKGKIEQNKKLVGQQKIHDLWDYLKNNHPKTYSLLKELEINYPLIYKKSLRFLHKIYKRMNTNDNQEIKEILKSEIDNYTELTSLTIQYHENKISESEFDQKATQILSKIHDNKIKIFELKILELKNKKSQLIQQKLKEIKQKEFRKNKKQQNIQKTNESK